MTSMHVSQGTFKVQCLHIGTIGVRNTIMEAGTAQTRANVVACNLFLVGHPRLPGTCCAVDVHGPEAAMTLNDPPRILFLTWYTMDKYYCTIQNQPGPHLGLRSWA